MSFGFSVSDIITCYKLANDIYDRCFTKAQRADVKYLQFGREISSLGDSLRGLEKIIKNAEDQRPPRRPWHSDADHFGVALETLPEVTGDFRRTLKDVQTLLDDHSKFHRSAAGFVDNVIWWAGTERDVNTLKERVHFHVTKVSFILKPFEIQLLLGIKRELQQLRADVADLRGVVVESINRSQDPSWSSPPPTFAVPQELMVRFMIALDVNKPAAFDNVNNWPLKEAFDALVFHFAHSTVEFNPLPQLGQKTPEEPQYLNLVKSQWIVQRLKSSPRFHAAGPDSLWADYMRELEGDIRGQFKRFDAGSLEVPDLSVVSRLPDDCFSVWLIDTASLPPPNLAEERSLEEKILELALPRSFGTRLETLSVFRISDVDLRMVKTTRDEQNPFLHLEESTELSMNSNRLIPIYVDPSDSSIATNNVLLCNGQGNNPKSYPLNSPKDVSLFQQALTGYRVSHQMSGFSWCINGSSAYGDSGKGILQLWHLKPFQKIPSEAVSSSPKQSDSSVASPRSQDLWDRPSQSAPSTTMVELEAAQAGNTFSFAESFSGTTFNSGFNSPELRKTSTAISSSNSDVPIGGTSLKPYSTGMSSKTLVSRSSIASPVNGSHGEGTLLLRPENPVLIVFTICAGKHTFLHIPIDSGVRVNPDLCSCNKKKKICTRAVIDSKLKPFIIRKVPADQGLYSWDLAQFRCPRRHDFSNLKVLDKTKWLDLTFSTVAAKEEFITEFRLMENLRNTNNNDYERDFQERRRQSHKPGRNKHR